MAVDPPAESRLRKWALTQEAFDRLLAALDSNRDSAAEKYLEIRRNLVRLFEWRGCTNPDEYADETLNRCARKMGEGEQIRDVPTYCVGIARMVLREAARERTRGPRPLDDIAEPRTSPQEIDVDSESRIACLRQCLARISPQSRDLILNYYQGDKSEKIRSRTALSERLGVPAGTLRMRALRVREALFLCTEDCLRNSGEKLA